MLRNNYVLSLKRKSKFFTIIISDMGLILEHVFSTTHSGSFEVVRAQKSNDRSADSQLTKLDMSESNLTGLLWASKWPRSLTEFVSEFVSFRNES